MIYCNLEKDVIFLTNEQRLINFASMPSSGSGLFENFVFTATVPKEDLCRIRYLALSSMLWNGTARFIEVRRQFRDLNTLRELFIIETLRSGESRQAWESRAERILLKFSVEMRPKVKVIESELALREAVEKRMQPPE